MQVAPHDCLVPKVEGVGCIMVRLLTGASPRLSKARQKKLGSLGIVLRRTREGKLIFRCNYNGSYSTFTVTSNGEKWLKQERYEDGHTIDWHLVRDLHDFGYIANTDAWLTRPSSDAQPSHASTTNQQRVTGYIPSVSMRGQENRVALKSPSVKASTSMRSFTKLPDIVVPPKHQSARKNKHDLKTPRGVSTAPKPVVTADDLESRYLFPSGVPRKLAKKAARRKKR